MTCIYGQNRGAFYQEITGGVSTDGAFECRSGRRIAHYSEAKWYNFGGFFAWLGSVLGLSYRIEVHDNTLSRHRFLYVSKEEAAASIGVGQNFVTKRAFIDYLRGVLPEGACLAGPKNDGALQDRFTGWHDVTFEAAKSLKLQVVCEQEQDGSIRIYVSDPSLKNHCSAQLEIVFFKEGDGGGRYYCPSKEGGSADSIRRTFSEKGNFMDVRDVQCDSKYPQATKATLIQAITQAMMELGNSFEVNGRIQVSVGNSEHAYFCQSGFQCGSREENELEDHDCKDVHMCSEGIQEWNRKIGEHPIFS